MTNIVKEEIQLEKVYPEAAKRSLIFRSVTLNQIDTIVIAPPLIMRKEQLTI